jgi:hypothetical protein
MADPEPIEHRLTLPTGREVVLRLDTDADGAERLTVHVNGKLWASGPPEEMHRIMERVNNERAAAQTEQPDGWPFE